MFAWILVFTSAFFWTPRGLGLQARDPNSTGWSPRSASFPGPSWFAPRPEVLTHIDQGSRRNLGDLACSDHPLCAKRVHGLCGVGPLAMEFGVYRHFKEGNIGKSQEHLGYPLGIAGFCCDEERCVVPRGRDAQTSTLRNDEHRLD